MMSRKYGWKVVCWDGSIYSNEHLSLDKIDFNAVKRFILLINDHEIIKINCENNNLIYFYRTTIALHIGSLDNKTGNIENRYLFFGTDEQLYKIDVLNHSPEKLNVDRKCIEHIKKNNGCDKCKELC